ncbi:MAG: glycosyl hydrolase 53 family protein [Anaerolineae bacterium]|nr:glycosyl hydrolase 53 family protein [Anaerolineae bacterium]
MNEMEDCGAVYQVNGAAKDPFQLFQEQGANLVRARLWHNADWTEYSNVPDVLATFSRAKEQEMKTLLDFHYSDNWADPGKQTIPAAWEAIDDEAALAQAVYDYTYETLMTFAEADLMPDFVQVGNETNPGLLKKTMESDWPRDAKLFNAGIKAVRDAAKATKTNPQIILHIAQPENTGWWFTQARENGVTDFDVIGISYYPQWSTFSVTDMGNHVTYLRQEFGKEVMVVETAYPWTYETAGDTADNVLDKNIRAYPPTIEGQRQFMIDLTQSLVSNGALGVVYWEPAWVSTECHTRWGQGSHWENATFFDFQNDNELHAGANFLGYVYKRPLLPIDGIIEENYGEPALSDAAGDSFSQQAQDDLLSLYIADDPDSLYLAVTLAGDLLAAQQGTLLIYLDTTQDEQGAAIDVGKRPITIADPNKPEFRLDITISEQKGTVGGSYAFYAWDGMAWQEITLTGAAAIHSGEPSIIELQIPKALLNNPSSVAVAAATVGKGRVHTAVDILGSSALLADLKDEVTINTFVHFDLSEPEQTSD